MGLSVVLSSAIVFFAVFVVIGTFTTFSTSVFELSQSATKSSKIDKNNFDTKIGINSLDIGSSNFTINLVNQGNLKLWNFEKFDVIASYNGTSNKMIDYLNFSNCPAFDGHWCIYEITNDYFDPNILNSNETAIIHANTTFTINTGPFTVNITTDNGNSITESRLA